MKKKILISLLLLISILSSYLIYLFFIKSNDNIQSIYLIPKDAIYILETQKPLDNWKAISKSNIWKHLQQNKDFKKITESVSKFDTIFNKQKTVLNTIGNREILMSAHVYSKKDFAFFYVIDLQKISRLNIIKKYLNTVVSDDLRITKRKYHNHEIIEVYDIVNQDMLSLSFIKNQMIASYVHTLVEASIDQYLEPEIGRNLNFLEVKNKVGFKNMFRMYVQYKYLDSFLGVFSNKKSEVFSSLNDALLFSGFNFNLKKDHIIANGVTNTNYKTSSYLQALQQSGEGSRSIYEVAPKHTAVYLSFAFESFDTFYTNFENIQKQNPEQFKLYLDGTERIENFLDINLKTHFMSWIDDEIALLQMSSSVSESNTDIALVLKANDIDAATENLEFILERINKKSPVKFKNIDYKGYPINYMSIKGFFKILLGDLFKDIEKPYFTIIDEYVIFSNHPNTLKTIINTYIKKETLRNSVDFKKFNDDFDKQSSVFTYINTSYLYANIYKFADNSTKKQLKANKDYVVCFSQIGMQLTPKDTYFESKLIIKFEDPEIVNTKYEVLKINPIPKSIVQITPDTNSSPIEISEMIFNIPEIFPTDLSAKEFVKKYPNGTIRFSVKLKNGLKHGRYKSYYENGSLKISGKYYKNEQSGSWRAYDLDEKEIYKKRFKR